MKKILLIDGDKDIPLDEVVFREEGKLQDYLEDHPTLIPLEDILEEPPDLFCIGREVPAGSGFIDLLFIDRDGLLTVVETKLRKNPEARREVIGQIIEYASYASRWSADDVYKIASEYYAGSVKVPEKNRGIPATDIMRLIVGDSYIDDDYRAKIEENLKDGRVRLIVAVDEIIESLRAMVTFLNFFSNFDILLLQVSDFAEKGGKRVLVPLLFGYTTRSASKTRTTNQWDEKSFFDDVRNKCDPKVADTIRKIFEFSNKNSDVLSWGKGTTYGSFTFRKKRMDKPVSVFTVTSTGSGWICFGELVARGKGVKRETLQTFRTALNKIPGISIPEDAIELGKFPTISMVSLLVEDTLKSFEETVLALCKRIEE